jgi:hypothetical protein
MTTDANIIKIKRSGTSGAPSSLKLGELAYSYLPADGNPTNNGGDRLFIGANGVNGSTGNANDIVVIGGKYFTDLLDHKRGQLTASSAIVTDSNSVVDRILTTGLNIGGTNGAGLDYTISTDNNNNLVLSTGTGNLSINGAYTLPNADGTAGYVLSTNGSGVVSWQAISSTTLTNNGHTAQLNSDGSFQANIFLAAEGSTGTSGYSFQNDGGYDSGMFSNADGQVQFYSNNNEVANFETDGTAYWQFTVPVSFTNGGSGGYTLPTADGSAGYVLTTNGSGVVSWAAAAASLTVDAGSGGPQTVSLLTDTLVTLSADGNITTTVAKDTNAHTVTTTVQLASDLTGINSVSGSSSTGQVVINSNDGTTTHSWAFTEDALFRLPSLGTITENTAPSGVGYSIILTPYGGTDSNQQLLVYPGGGSGEGNHLHLTTGALGTTSIFLGNDAQYVRTRTDGAMVIGTNDTNPETSGLGHRWVFNTDGTTTFPGYTFPAAHGSAGQALVDDGTGVLSWSQVSGTIYIGTTSFTTGNSSGSNTTIAGLTEIDVGDLVLSGNTIENGNNGTGDVELIANDGTGDKTWTFGGNGKLTLPNTDFIDSGIPTLYTTQDFSIGAGTSPSVWNFAQNGGLTFPSLQQGSTTSQYYGMYNLFAVQDGPFTVIGTADPSTGNVGPNSISISPGIEGDAWLVIPNNTDSPSTPTQLVNSNSAGKVQLQANTHHWNFNADGATEFPFFTFPGSNGTTGQVLTANASTGILQWTTLSQSFYIGSTSITTGNASGDVTHITGLTEVDVGNLVLNNSTVSTTGDTGSVTVVANTGNNDQTWTFDGSGVLTLPVTTSNGIGGEIVFPSAVSGTQATINYNIDTPGGAFELKNTDGAGNTLYAGLILDGYVINFTNTRSGTAHSWNLNPDGSTSFPNYTFPSADGSQSGQVLTTNGSGTLSWTTLSQNLYIGTTEFTTGNSSGSNTTIAGLTEIDVGSLVFSSNTIATTGSSGAVTIESNDGTTNHTWTFGTDGTLELPMGGIITNVSSPTLPNDVANKAYVDATAQGLKIHNPVTVATTAPLSNIGGTVSYTDGNDIASASVGATLTFTTPITALDNYTFQGNERILVKDQVDATQNGVYVYTSSTVWTRATDFDHPGLISGADFMFVEDGLVNGSTGWVQTDQSITSIGASGSDITFVQFSAANSYLSGDGINITGNTIAVKLGTNSGLTLGGGSLSVNSTLAGDGLGYSSGVINVQYDNTSIDLNGSNQLEIKSTWVGQTAITTVGTITTGTWQGDGVTEIYGGTGQTSYAKGDILYASDTNTLSKLTAGTNGQTLQLQGGVPVWADLDGGTY